MSENKADLLFHPVRMRIVLAMTGRQLTVQQLAEVLPDVPQATLYRQLKTLADGGLLAVVAKRPVRGTVEKVYALPEQAANLTAEELAHAGREEHMRYFTTFVGSLLGEFWRYLQRERIDFFADGVGYRQLPLYLSDAEFVELVGKLNAVFMAYLGNGPAPERVRRVFTSIVIPDD